MKAGETIIWDQEAAPRGFQTATGMASVKPSNTTRHDVALIYSPDSCTSAAVYTTNQVWAAPIDVCRDTLADHQARALVVNSGNANASTGQQGEIDAYAMRSAAAEALGIDPAEVLVASTGVIGLPMPMERLTPVIASLGSKPGPYRPRDIACAIKTTDKFEKYHGLRLPREDGEVVISAVAKGAGMICPNMATMLCFVQTDARLTPAAAQKALTMATEASFNRTLVDGDTSTNDMVSLMANGASRTEVIDTHSDFFDYFASALTELLLHLAKEMVRDGEGSTKVVHIVVKGAASDSDARLAARAIADSNLCKTAFFGCDPNWGRIAAAAGYSGAKVNRHDFDIFFDDAPMVRGGISLGDVAEEQCAKVLSLPEFRVTLDLKLGSGTHDYWCSDLGYEYVRINADYRT
ncbi:bifunctional glutamate N-acetyltransferase/amino-acid acetyltransferase ArgJ [Desulfurispira natronophila]|uniref:Arginine biosynthesis bifunctional protein ArgJ n=1 Tax=Desulfurispira natronophila TaxID=682562 RepID=A0A7W7Y5V5_9BACT|nr:bifunctional glutamate N-acetyltransferase/amino-acid acetyltransferase ArgJ [Desulfurispira natronophila]MBB5022661.1 glutamate N-acetyltransferase/amino-acid N-acetyltransferase [Desulfurispira natronophila]